MLRLTLLGQPQLKLGRTEPTLPRKALALMAYLSLEGPTPRAKLAELLWGSEQEGGRSNLRQLLHHIGKTALDRQLASDGKSLGLEGDYHSDVDGFKQAVAQGRWCKAIELYTGDFLEGLDLGEADGFEEWLHRQREELLGLYCHALEQQALQLETRGDGRGALKLFLELLRRDELQEHYHRQAMRLYAVLGEREAALRQFARCQVVLKQELGLEPLGETTQLADQIRLCNLALAEGSGSVSVLELLRQGFATPLEMVEYLEQICYDLRQQIHQPQALSDDFLLGVSHHLPPAALTTNPAASSSRPNPHQWPAIRSRKTPDHRAIYTR